MSAMFEDKIKKLKEQIKKEKLDAVFVSSVSSISYLTGFFGFSKDEREAYLFIGKDFQYIITDGRYAESVKKQVSDFMFFERGFKNSTEDLFKKFKGKIQTIGIEEDNLTVAEYKIIKKHFKNLKNINLGNLRNIKTEKEVEQLQKACEIGDLAFEYILKKIKAGVSEKEIANELEKFIKEKGAENSFSSIVAFGKNSSIPHHQTGLTQLDPKRPQGVEGQFVLLDFGVKFENYCSDMTRTIFFGKPSEKQKDIYETALEAQKKTIDFVNEQLKSGKKVKASEVDKIARKYIESKNYLSIPHSLGHGIGLEVHEHPFISPNSKDELKAGMVFSIEPGIYIEDYGGVRIEDLFVLEKDGIKQITNSPKELAII